MGYGSESLTKRRTIALHRAACRGLRLAGRQDGRLSRDEWEAYCARASNVGSRTQQHNLNYRLLKLGLLQLEEEGVVVLDSDYANIITSDD